ncbi:MAG: complex I subunit 4 family protein, partial [Chloroflexota bacterium]
MILIWLVVIPLLAGLLAWATGFSSRWPRWISLAGLLADLALVLTIWAPNFATAGVLTGFGYTATWIVELNLNWIPSLGIGFRLAMDGLSLVLVALTCFLGILAIFASWREVDRRVGLFHLCIMWVLAGIIGVFLAVDLFLFYFFWEMMLVPTYFLFFWGYERRLYAAVKFFLFTQISGLFMLLAILGLYFAHGQSTGTFSFAYADLLNTSLSGSLAFLFMLGFFFAFAVKLPVVPLHTWLPPAYTESPTAATVILAGIMAKTGGYGLLRFLVPLFPDAAFAFAPAAMALGVVGILYGGILAFSQTDLKRLIAYSSISHMGFVILGIFAWNELALQGAVMVMVAHGVSTGALFIIAGQLQERTGTRDLARLGGLWSTVPRLGGVTLLFVLATLGLPGLGNFVGEFLVLVGTFRVSIAFASVAALGVVLAVIYALRLLQRVYHGPNPADWRLADLSWRESAVIGVLVFAILGLGLYPQPVLNTVNQGLNNLDQYVRRDQGQAAERQSLVLPPSVAAD